MAMSKRHFLISWVLIIYVLELLMRSAYVSYGTMTDLHCLQSIRNSFPDLDWDLTNNTEGSICNFIGIECWHLEESRVLNIKLQDMDLKGQFPVGIIYCTSLNGLDLSGNELYGSIPSNISKLIPYVTTLDLSNNNISGVIPADLSNCSFLNALQLDHNHFSGEIPQQLATLTRLKQFSVASNNLIGSTPSFERPFSVDSYADNPGLCGYPLPNLCPVPRKKLKFNDGLIAGGVGFAVGFVLVITVNLMACNMFM